MPETKPEKGEPDKCAPATVSRTPSCVPRSSTSLARGGPIATRYPIPARVHRVEETIQRSRFVTTVAHAPDAEAAHAFVETVRSEEPEAEQTPEHERSFPVVIRHGSVWLRDVRQCGPNSSRSGPNRIRDGPDSS